LLQGGHLTCLDKALLFVSSPGKSGSRQLAGGEKSRSENAVSRESGKREGNPWYEIDRSIQQLLDLPNALN
jgi:hypothetical protein